MVKTVDSFVLIEFCRLARKFCEKLHYSLPKTYIFSQYRAFRLPLIRQHASPLVSFDGKIAQRHIFVLLSYLKHASRPRRIPLPRFIVRKLQVHLRDCGCNSHIFAFYCGFLWYVPNDLHFTVYSRMIFKHCNATRTTYSR